MKKLIICVFGAAVLAGLFAGCQIQGDIMSESEKLFIKMIYKAAEKLDLNEQQKVELERLKMDVKRNFLEGKKEKVKLTARINEEKMKEKPDTQKISSMLQELLRNETGRINRAFELTLNYQKNLNDTQVKIYNQLITQWVTED